MIDILWGYGIDKYGEIIDIAVETNVIKKSGSWFSYEDSKLGQGSDNVKQMFIDNPKLFEEIKRKKLLINLMKRKLYLKNQKKLS